MKTNREELIEILSENISKIKGKRKVIGEIKQYLTENHAVMEGTVQEILNDPKEKLKNIDMRLLFLINQQVYMKTGNMKLEPSVHFTDVEERESKLYEGFSLENPIKLPFKLDNVFSVGANAYGTIISAKQINDFLSSQLLHYDPELQREMKAVKVKDQVRYEPTLVKKNVDEIAQHLIKRTLVPTTIVWNAMLNSSDEGEELIYDENEKSLVITEGTKLAMVDGYHRTKAVQLALSLNPEIDFNFQLLITNYNKHQAQQYQAQLAESTPISKNRKEQLKAEKYGDTIVTRLMVESDLKDKVSTNPKIKLSVNQLVSYNVLRDSIEDSFEMKTKREATLVGDFLVTFFDELLGLYPEVFITETSKYRQQSYMNNNNMFVGYVTLAAKMYKNDIPVSKLEETLNEIDFDKSNKLWEKIGLSAKNNNTNTELNRKNIKEYFEKIAI